ncbi:MAG: hypothetical protein WC575_04565 [Patescibacteria group bacterium]
MEQNFNAINQKQSKEERRVYIALFLVSIIALILGYWQITNNIRLPFILPAISPSSDTGSALTISDDQLVLQNQDSDKDGLSDYDELYVYKTSPYLKDTDSDGYTDDTEIASGNNPTCPAGQTCLVAPANTTGAALAPRTTTELRALLKESGVSEEQLTALDDATLLEVYNEIISGTSTTGQAISGSEPVNTNSESASDAGKPNLTEAEKKILREMSGAEIRTYLKQNGVAAETLDNIDDNTLKTLINQTLGL